MDLVSPFPGGKSVTFARPLALVLLGLLPLTGYLAWRSRARLSGGRMLVSTLLRLAGVTVLALAVAGISIADARLDTTVFVLDVSDSVLLAEQALHREWVREAIESAPEERQVAFIEVGEEARITRLPTRIGDLPGQLFGSAFTGGTDGSDLPGAIGQALALIRDRGTGRIVLLTDGRTPPAGLDIVLAKAADAAIPISFVPPLLPDRADIALDPLQTPAYTHLGKAFEVQVVVVARREADVRLRLWAGDRLAADTQIQIQPGVNPLGTRVVAEEEGLLVLRAEILDDADALTANNVAEGVVRVLPQAGILLVGELAETAALASAMGTQGYRAVEIQAADLPVDPEELARFAAVVLVDIPASAISASQTRALATFVRDRGHGLVVTGGPNSFGPGEYEGTDLEALLPVRSRPPDEEEKGLALVLVLDRSSSMSLMHADISKIAIAREAAIQAVRLLEVGDQIGILAFSMDSVWIVPPTRIESSTDLADIETRIRAMGLGGSTDVYSAIQTARRRLATLEAGLKHMIVLTDGQASYGDFNVFSAQARRDGTSVSTVAIGQDADRELLEKLARDANGRYYETDDPRSIPALLTRETELARSFFLVDRRHQPRVAQPSPVFTLVAPGDPIPYLRGFVRTNLRPEATAVLVSDSNDPILATWRVGFGRVAVWTSNFGGEWTDEWRAWSEFENFVGGLANWVVAGAQDQQAGLRVSVRSDSDRVTVIVDSLDADGRFRNQLPTSGIIRTPDGFVTALIFEQRAPGRYEATFAGRQPGAHELVLEQALPGGGTIGPILDGFVLSYSDEFQQGRPGRALLEGIAARTGGEAVPAPARAFGGGGLTNPEGLIPLLLTVGTLLFVADVAVRRVRTGRAELREQYTDVLEWLDHHHPGRLAAMISRRLRQGFPGPS